MKHCNKCNLDVNTFKKTCPLCGELLDIDGVCGGFNLQWAWTSAYIVSKSISDRIKSSL